ncbi:MAG TPA: transcriptional regulator, partial [Methylotenera sp.]|nr:transcriptional regulator [Methylotenera sp.]
VQQEGRFQRYKANFSLMLETIDYLTEECCAGNPGQCATIRSESSCSPNVLPKINQFIEEN